MLIDLINDYKIVSIMVFMRIVCLMVFVFIATFFSMKRNYGNDDFYTNYYFLCEKVL